MKPTGDQEAVYAPRQGNDRLLLGLKGSLNEYELDLLRQRSLAARLEKARRGELVRRRGLDAQGVAVRRPLCSMPAGRYEFGRSVGRSLRVWQVCRPTVCMRR